MVQQQVRSWDVSDADVLRVISELQRDQFVPAGYEALAYADTEIPLPHNQTMMMPSIEGRLLQALTLRPGHNVLEIGAGSGFLTACLASLAAAVTSVDIFSDLVAMAKASLADAGIRNVELICMDATADLPTGQFDAVAVTGSLPIFDPRFLGVLKPGGRLFVIVGDSPVMDARVVTNIGDNEWTTKSLFETDIPALLNASRPSAFSF